MFTRYIVSAALVVCTATALPSGVFELASRQERSQPYAYRTSGPPPGYNETYGYPDGIGALIIEGPFPYKNGPAIWSDKTRWGAYALINAAASLTKGGQCPKVPKDSPFAGSKLNPVPLTNGAKLCMIGCNLTEVKSSGEDPCSVGSVADPSNSPMSCFDVGPGFAGGWGLCGYNCTALEPKTRPATPCSKADLGGDCSLYCDTRAFPSISN